MREAADMARSLWHNGGKIYTSFRGDAQHRTRNLEIPRCAIAHLRSGSYAPSRNDGFQKRRPACASLLNFNLTVRQRRFPQKRWMRLQASSRSEVLVA